ncbi:hypothetical protein [Moorena sp. SIO3I8]|uniref:hypothetical protein n=1 Tax=Moorena sp. SIO3I8 TaxID=2607833 RepID=UPI0013C25A91|nr:hypothetical protein [Moorena sp. SIO3I8]NEO10419.1 hypothetical protein [Moorena sp. SIO3I8]
MGRVGSVGRWGDGEMGEIFIKGNYPDMMSEDNYMPTCKVILRNVTLMSAFINEM